MKILRLSPELCDASCAKFVGNFNCGLSQFMLANVFWNFSIKLQKLQSDIEDPAFLSLTLWSLWTFFFWSSRDVFSNLPITFVKTFSFSFLRDFPTTQISSLCLICFCFFKFCVLAASSFKNNNVSNIWEKPTCAVKPGRNVMEKSAGFEQTECLSEPVIGEGALTDCDREEAALKVKWPGNWRTFRRKSSPALRL